MCPSKRDIDAVCRELTYVAKNCGLLAGLIGRLVKATEEGYPELRKYVSKIVGYVEHLVAEALSLLLSMDLYVGTAPDNANRCIIWNGSIETMHDYSVFVMAGPGLPDIEVYDRNICLLVELTLSRSCRAILHELVDELIRHSPRRSTSIIHRMIMTPLLGEELVELRRFVQSYFQDGRYRPYIASLHTLVRITCERREFSSVMELVNELGQDMPSDDETRRYPNVQVPSLLSHILQRLRHYLSRGSY